MTEILEPAHASQLSKHLALCLARGAGCVRISVEYHKIKRLQRAIRTYNPAWRIINDIKAQPLSEMLGAWLIPFLDALAEVMGLGWGSVEIGVRNGRIDYVESSTSVDAD